MRRAEHLAGLCFVAGMLLAVRLHASLRAPAWTAKAGALCALLAGGAWFALVLKNVWTNERHLRASARAASGLPSGGERS